MEKALNDGDYTLADEGIWVTAGPWSIRIYLTRNEIDESFLEVSVYKLGKEVSDPIDYISLSE